MYALTSFCSTVIHISHSFQWAAMAILSCLHLYSFWANIPLEIHHKPSKNLLKRHSNITMLLSIKLLITIYKYFFSVLFLIIIIFVKKLNNGYQRSRIFIGRTQAISSYYILCVDISVIKPRIKMIPVKWYDMISLHGFELSNQIDCNNLVGPIGLHVLF